MIRYRCRTEIKGDYQFGINTMVDVIRMIGVLFRSEKERERDSGVESHDDSDDDDTVTSASSNT